jgi:hypothetical protein
MDDETEAYLVREIGTQRNAVQVCGECLLEWPHTKSCSFYGEQESVEVSA